LKIWAQQLGKAGTSLRRNPREGTTDRTRTGRNRVNLYFLWAQGTRDDSGHVEYLFAFLADSPHFGPLKYRAKVSQQGCKIAKSMLAFNWIRRRDFSEREQVSLGRLHHLFFRVDFGHVSRIVRDWRCLLEKSRINPEACISCHGKYFLQTGSLTCTKSCRPEGADQLQSLE
jgi:hypothetical protein